MEGLSLSTEEEIDKFKKEIFIPYMIPAWLSQMLGSASITKSVVLESTKMMLTWYAQNDENNPNRDARLRGKSFDSLWQYLMAGLNLYDGVNFTELQLLHQQFSAILDTLLHYFVCPPSPEMFDHRLVMWLKWACNADSKYDRKVNQYFQKTISRRMEAFFSDHVLPVRPFSLPHPLPSLLPILILFPSPSHFTNRPCRKESSWRLQVSAPGWSAWSRGPWPPRKLSCRDLGSPIVTLGSRGAQPALKPSGRWQLRKQWLEPKTLQQVCLTWLVVEVEVVVPPLPPLPPLPLPPPLPLQCTPWTKYRRSRSWDPAKSPFSQTGHET